MSGSVYHVIPLKKASKILQLFNLHLSWWSISSIFVKHLSSISDKVIKDDQFFKCLPEVPLRIRITGSNEVSFFNNYNLVATINHSGSFKNGHGSGSFILGFRWGDRGWVLYFFYFLLCFCAVVGCSLMAGT